MSLSLLFKVIKALSKKRKKSFKQVLPKGAGSLPSYVKGVEVKSDANAIKFLKEPLPKKTKRKLSSKKSIQERLNKVIK